LEEETAFSAMSDKSFGSTGQRNTLVE